MRRWALLWCLVSVSTHADENSISTYAPPELVKPSAPTYPRQQQMRGGEGWVSLNFMVDDRGKPYDITVFQSSGEPAFERAAEKAVKRFKYKPAEYEGRNIDAGAQINITFELQGSGSGAMRSFRTHHAEYVEAVEREDEAAAAAALDKMREVKRNLYEEAFYQVMVANYQSRWGLDGEAEYQALQRAAFVDNDRGYLPEKLLTEVLFRKLDLELKANRLAQARMTASTIERRETDEEENQYLQGIIQAIDDAARAEGVVRSRGRLRENYEYVHLLIRPSFSVEEIDGDIAEARLHCDKGFVGFPFRETMQYTIEKGWSDCTLILVGNPDTTFTIVES